MTRKKKAGIVLAVLVVMAVAATAVAAIVLYKDSSGAVTGGKIESATAGTALVVTANGALPDLVKGNNVNWPLKATNQDAQLPHTPQTWTAVATVPTMPACDAAISVTNVPTFPLTPVAAGASVTFNANISVNASLPVGCAGKDVLLTIGGTTT